MIIHENDYVPELIIAATGKLKLYGFYDSRGEKHKMHVVTLPTRSWYGDFQILLNIESTFQIEAGYAKKSKTNKVAGVLQIYKLNGETLLDLAAEYPIYRRFLILRAT